MTPTTQGRRRKLFVIDGTALAYRSFFALQRNPLINSKGLNTSAIFGFTQSLTRLIDKEQPDYLAVAFDSGEPTFRHQLFADYKATREKMPDEMVDQLPYIDQVVRAMNIPILMQPSLEADDLIAALIKKFSKEAVDCYIVSGDKDFMQLINDRVFLYSTGKATEPPKIVAAKEVREKFGVDPEQMIDLLSLIGDSSDNVPGLSGVGPKTAAQLLDEFKSVEGLIRAAKNGGKELSDKLRQQILDGQGKLQLARELITLNHEPDPNWNLSLFESKPWNSTALAKLFRELEFRTLEAKVLAMQSSEPAQPQSSGSSHYHLISDDIALEKLLSKLKTAEHYTFDCETTDLDFTKAKLVGIAFSMQSQEAWYVPLFDKSKWLDRLKPILSHPHAQKGGHNIKYDLLILKRHGVEVSNIAFDSMIESYLLQPNERTHGLDHLSLRYLQKQKIPIASLIGSGKTQITMDQVEPDRVAQYAGEDADCALRLHQLFSKEIEQHKLTKLYQDIEIPLLTILFKMQFTGIRLDSAALKKTANFLEQRLKELTEIIYRESGETFNINSPKQLATILFEKLALHKNRLKRLKKTKEGFSTDISVLESLRPHPLIDALIDFRNASKLKSTYTDTLPLMVDADGKIHSHFNQTVAATGRLSSSDPNLQNIPIRTDLGRLIRQAFIPNDPKSVLLSADYSQIELRILAHLSDDRSLIQFFQDDRDIHAQTAARLFKVKPEEIDSSSRARAKAINFGILYGMGPQRLAKETGVSMNEAQEFIAAYFKAFPKVGEYIEVCKQFAKDHGFVSTMLGRIRQVSEIHNSNPRLQSEAERIAINTPIQGSAADLIKLAMIRLDKELTSHELESQLLLQVHDELLLNVPKDELEQVVEITKEAMVKAFPLKVPLKIEIGSGNNWLEAHP